MNVDDQRLYRPGPAIPEEPIVRPIRPHHCASTCVALWLVTAAPLTAQSDGISKCDKPVGTLAVVEPNAQALSGLRRYGLESPTSLIRVFAQKSNCFVVVERGKGLQTMQGERQLAQSGELKQGANVGGGQMEAADFYLTPDVIFSEGDAGGVGGAVGGILGRRTGGAVGGGLKFKEAQTSLLLGDVRSGVQVAAADGKAKKADVGAAVGGLLGGVGVAAGGYTKTNEGKVIAASFLNNYNKIVADVRKDPRLKGMDASAVRSSVGNSGVRAGAAVGEGDVLYPKIENVKLLAEPTNKAPTVATLKKSEELVFLGEEKDGFLHVQGASGEGWVKKVLVSKR
jgi:curli biogenesis system outer membrane secretion channel CsgG